MPDLVLKQVLAVIDSRTTPVCLHAAGQTRPLDEPFETLLGDQDDTPFHVHCRSMVVPWMPGFVNDLRRDANAELLRRPLKQRRIGPGGQTGPLPPKAGPSPGLPPGAQASSPRLGRELQQHGNLPLREVPEKFRKAYVEGHPERFELTSNGGGISETYWVKDLQTGDRYVLKAGQYHNETIAEVIGTRVQHEVGFRSQVIPASDMGSGNGWVLLKHVEDIAEHQAAGYKVVGTSGSHAAQAKMIPRLEDPGEAVKKLMVDFAIDEADAKGGNMLLLSKDGGKTIRLAPIDRSLSQMGWREAVEPGKTSVVAGDWSLAGRLKVSTLREYMKTRGSPKGVLEAVKDLADTPGGAQKVVDAYDEALAALKRIDMADLTRGLPEDLVVENVALIRRRIDLLETKREQILKEMGVAKVAKVDAPKPEVVGDTWSAARDRGHAWLHTDTADRALVTGKGHVGGPRWIGDSLGDTLEEFRTEYGPDWAEVYDRAAATLGTLADEFPEAMQKVSFVRMARNPDQSEFAWYRHGTGDITLNMSTMGDLAELQRRYDASIATKWFADADGSDAVMGILAHETGHHLDYALEALGTAKNDAWPTMWRRIGEEMRKIDGKVKSGTAARKPENLARYGRDLVSTYGAKSQREFIAEAFTEYMTSPNPRPVATIVGEAFYDAFGKKMADDVAASAGIRAGRVRRGAEIPRTVIEEPIQEIVEEVIEAVALPAPGPLKVLNTTDHQVMAEWQEWTDAEARGLAVWQESFDAVTVIRQMIRNVDEGRDVWHGLDDALDKRWLDAYQQARNWSDFSNAYSEADLKNDLLNAARVLREYLDEASEAPVLYRGMRVPDAEDLFGVGDTIEANLSSWTTVEEHAHRYADTLDIGTGKKEEWDKVVMVVRDAKVADLDRNGKVRHQYKHMHEYLSDMRVRVTRQYRQDGRLYVEVEPVG